MNRLCENIKMYRCFMAVVDRYGHNNLGVKAMADERCVLMTSYWIEDLLAKVEGKEVARHQQWQPLLR